MFSKRLPIAPIKGREKIVHFELLSHIYKDSSIIPVSCEIEKNDEIDYLTQKYLDKVEGLMLNVKGDVVFSLIRLFDSKMFAFNYPKFHS